MKFYQEHHNIYNVFTKGENMKKRITLIIVLLLLTVANTVTYAEKPDIVLSLKGYSPSDDDMYSSGFGAEAQIRFWPTSVFGIGLSLGAATWDVEPYYYSEYSYYDGRTYGEIDGDISLVPFGPSILIAPNLGSKVDLLLEAGLRYVAVDSNVTATVSNYYYGTYEFDIDIEDGIIGVLGVGLDVHLSEIVSLVFGLGYQFDLSKGEAELEGIDVGDHELEAFYAHFGVSIQFGR